MTATALQFEVAPIPVEAPSAPRPAHRPHLRVVGPDEVVVRPRLRLTARGRLVCTLAAFGALSLLALLVWARVASVALPPTHAVTVQPGQTLSEIAAQELPMLPLEAAQTRIRLANGLSGSALISGQSVVIPGEGS